ncbi:ABC transporter substrate-binding protein [Streptomyces sp. NPDC059881]|uniref:ABC transporter substrate-binding protein n=1 Tax=Streptomyces sp. NPDC059881 TaxID=3346986 RepID=UPI003666A947
MTARRLLIGLVPLLLAATACGDGDDAATTTSDSGKKLDKVTLTLNWYPYGEHAPFYYGKQQKIFEKHGIDLTINAGQGSQKTVQATGAGQTDFGWADTPAVLAGVDQGVKVKSLGVFLQTTPSSVQFFDSAGIKSPADLKGRTIAGTAGDALSKTFPIFLEKNGLSEADVKVQNTDPAGKIAAVISGKTDGLLGYASDQGPTMQNKAKKNVSYLRFSENGLNFYSNGLIAGQKTLGGRSDVAKRMVQAVSEAWAAVPSTGDWGNVVSPTTPLLDPGRTVKLYAVFTNPEWSAEKPDLYAVDWLHFNGPGVEKGKGTKVSVSAAPATGTAPLAVQLASKVKPASGRTIASYHWDFGDNAKPTAPEGPTATHTYARPGSYTAHLTVTDDKGDTTTGAARITVS